MLKVREDHVRSVLDETRRRLGEVTKDPSQYSVVLEALVTQGLLQVKLEIYCCIGNFIMINQYLIL